MYLYQLIIISLNFETEINNPEASFEEIKKINVYLV